MDQYETGTKLLVYEKIRFNKVQERHIEKLLFIVDATKNCKLMILIVLK